MSRIIPGDELKRRNGLGAAGDLPAWPGASVSPALAIVSPVRLSGPAASLALVGEDEV